MERRDSQSTPSTASSSPPGSRASTSSKCRARDSGGRQPAPGLCAWGRATDSLAHPKQIRPWCCGPRGTLLPPLRSQIPTFLPPVEESVQARQTSVQKPEGQRILREGGSGSEAASTDARSRERGRETRAQHARGQAARKRGLRQSAGRGRPGAEPEAGWGRGQGRASTPRGGVRRGGDALAEWGRRGRGGGGSVPGLRPCFPLSYLRPSGAPERRRLPVPRSRPAAAAPSLRSR